MGEDKRENQVKEGLSGKIERTVRSIIRHVLLIVFAESILISGALAIAYTLNKNQSNVTEYTLEIDEAMQKKVSMLEAIASGISSGTLVDQADVLAYVDAMVEMDDQISAVYSCYDENITVMSGGWQPPEDFVVTEREWYQKAQENPDEVYVSAPYVDLQSGGICVTLSKATYRDGKMVGVVGMDMYMDDLISREVLNEKIGGTKQEMERLERELELVSYHLTKGEQLENLLNGVFREIEDITDVREMTNAQLKRIIQKIEVDKDGNVDIYQVCTFSADNE